MKLLYGNGDVEITDEAISDGIMLAPTYSIEDYVENIFDLVGNILEKEHKDSACCVMDEVCDLVVRHRDELLKEDQQAWLYKVEIKDEEKKVIT